MTDMLKDEHIYLENLGLCTYILPIFFNYTVSEWGGQVSKMTPQVNITLKWMIFSEQLIFQSVPHPKLQKMYIEVCKLYEVLL